MESWNQIAFTLKLLVNVVGVWIATVFTLQNGQVLLLMLSVLYTGCSLAALLRKEYPFWGKRKRRTKKIHFSDTLPMTRP